MKAKAARHARAKTDQAAAVRAGEIDRKLAAAALLVAVAAISFVIYVVPPGGDYNQTYQVAMLCVLAVAIAGRALLGHTPPDAEPPPRPWLARFALPLVFLAAVLPYLPSLWVGLLSDDHGVMVAMTKLHGPLEAVTRHVFPIQFRPLHALAWWVQYQLWGAAPAGYHVVSVLLHGANAMLVCLLGRRFTGSLPAALLAGLLFALHPIHTETIAWLASQVDLQATLFALLSLLSLDQYLTTERPGSRALGLAFALLAFALAALTKESALALPALAGLWVLAREQGGWRKAGTVVGSFGLVLVGYLALRLTSLQGFGGYPSVLDLWNTAFPSAPMRQILTFFFPLIRSYLGGWPLLPCVLALSAFLYWVLRALRAVPGPRLSYYLGFVLLASVPVWILSSPTPDLEYTRFAYLPTIGLAWAIGDLCAARGLAWRKAGGVTAAMLALCAALCLWYQLPWLRAQQISQQVLAASARMVAEAPPSATEPQFYVQSLPDTHVGAQVFRKGFTAALERRVGYAAQIHIVGRRGDVPSEVMRLFKLLPGEYVYEWEPKSKRMELVKQGGRP